VAEISYPASAEIAAPIEVVFAYRLDFAKLPAYNPSVTNLRQVAGDGPGKGAEYVFDLTLAEGADPIESPLRVIEVDEPTRVVIESGPGFMARETCTFTATSSGTRCDFDTVLSFPGEIDAASADAVRAQGLAQVQLELDLMKKNLEG
jgi:hypothetical protein